MPDTDNPQPATPHLAMTLATPRNMQAALAKSGQPVSVPGLFAYSPNTGERYSASPGDYWDAPLDEPLRDSEGEPIVLVRESSRIDSA